MASAIHHGPPGSYKSFAVVQRFSIEALKAGRVVITNVRGFDSLDRIKDVFPDIDFPESARLLFIDTSTQIARDYFACWYKWIPFRALVIIDEAQTIYPDRIDFKLEHLDKIQIAEDFFHIEELPEPRPKDVFTAFDKQRHYQWDIYLTTTNIAKIKRDIRESSEWAYRHRSLSEVAFFLKGQWYEHQHDPENNGKADSHRIGKPRKYKADQRIFKCYQSTATGEHTASQAGTTLFSDSGIRTKFGFALLAILCSIGFFIYKINTNPPTINEIAGTPPPVAASTPKTTAVTAPKVPRVDTPKANHTFNNPLSTVKVDNPANKLIPSQKWRISAVIKGSKKKPSFFVVASDLGGHTFLLPKTNCQFDAYSQPTCFIEGEIVTKYTGSYLLEATNKSQQPKLLKKD